MSVSCILISLKIMCVKCRMKFKVHTLGPSRNISLHTVVYYVGHDGEANTFCTISESLQHDPAAIWAHLDPVLDKIQNKHPEIDTIHYLSDGPYTQYKQKANFFLFTQSLSQRGMTFGTWNFFESGHGKGVPDGVGATVKRMSHQRSDCKDTTDMYTNLKSANCKFISTFYQQRSLKYQLKLCCQWLT